MTSKNKFNKASYIFLGIVASCLGYLAITKKRLDKQIALAVRKVGFTNENS